VQPLRDARARFVEMRQWWRELSTELVQLPTSLQKVRDGATNFQLVGQRLAESSTALEELTRLYSRTVGQSVQRSTALADSLRSQVDKLSDTPVAPDKIAAAVAELRSTVEALASYNPFWPDRGGSRPR
jgi:DNA repair ATPase RecN